MLLFVVSEVEALLSGRLYANLLRRRTNLVTLCSRQHAPQTCLRSALQSFLYSTAYLLVELSLLEDLDIILYKELPMFLCLDSESMDSAHIILHIACEVPGERIGNKTETDDPCTYAKRHLVPIRRIFGLEDLRADDPAKLRKSSLKSETESCAGGSSQS